MPVITVGQLNNYIKKYIDYNEALNNLYIKGEISNFKHHQSGHIYLTLKDESSVLKCVMFQTYASGLKFTPENGMKVIAFGKISVYERDGVYQLYIQSLVPDGKGELYAAYEQLKDELDKLGYFDQTRKKTIPAYPSTIGVVTSAQGAALRDILSILKRRYPICNVLVYPALVQGVGASLSIVKGIKYFDENKLADVIVIGRGGGSIEDLWAFNERIVADTIYHCSTPIISAVGHETDFTISDFVSDLRAPTPSAAAELAVPDMNELIVNLKKYDFNLRQALLYFVRFKKQKLETLINKDIEKLLYNKINDYRQRVDNLVTSCHNLYCDTLEKKKEKFVNITQLLDSLSPLKTMARGYCIAKDENGVIKTVENISKGKKLQLVLKDGYVQCVAEKTYKNQEV